VFYCSFFDELQIDLRLLAWKARPSPAQCFPLLARHPNHQEKHKRPAEPRKRTIFIPFVSLYLIIEFYLSKLTFPTAELIIVLLIGYQRYGNAYNPFWEKTAIHGQLNRNQYIGNPEDKSPQPRSCRPNNGVPDLIRKDSCK